MDWLQLLSGLGLGGAVGALLGVLAATQNAKQKFDALKRAVVDIAPEYRQRFQTQFDDFNSAFDQLKTSLETLGRALKRRT